MSKFIHSDSESDPILDNTHVIHFIMHKQIRRKFDFSEYIELMYVIKLKVIYTTELNEINQDVEYNSIIIFIF